jgi:hypothetical protein
MTLFKLAGTSAIAALLTGQAVWADITPEEIWQKWKDISAGTGQTLTTTSEERDGDTLTITGAVFASTQEGAESSMTIDEIALTDQGDGSVEITMSEAYQMSVTGTDSDSGEPTDILLDVTSKGMSVVASGTVEETAYDVNAEELKIALSSVDGVAAGELGTDVSATIKGITGAYSTTGTDVQVIGSDVKAASVDLSVKVAEPDTTNTVDFKATMAEIGAVGSTSVPVDTDFTDTAAALAAGFLVDAGFTYGQTDFSFDVVEGTETTKGVGTMTGGGLNVVMDATHLEYGTTTTGLGLTVSGSSIPLPEVKFGFSESAFMVTMPTAKTDAPADFKLLTKLVDFTISDDIWGMVDPAANLPRDPVTFIVEASGTGTLTESIFDEAAMGESSPPDINSLDLTQLTFKGVGAEVTGSGALTFDNSDTVTFQGMPKPTGTLTFNASGVNGLIDKLTAMGLIPEDQLMGARMMMGMFAKPGEGEDTLVSDVEFKDGGLFVNGMQLQ